MKYLLCVCVYLCSNLCFVHSFDCERVYYLSETTDNKLNVSFNDVSMLPQQFVHLSEFLNELNFSDCNISLLINPGVYVLSGSLNISLNEVVTIKNVEDSFGAAVVTCQETINAGLTSKPQLWFTGSQLPGLIQGTVNVEGIMFHSCAYSIRFDYLDRLEIHNSIFKNFNSPALDISSVLSIHINSSQFIANNVTSLNDPFRAGAAGLSIAYNFQSTIPRDPILIIKYTVFINNTASIPSILPDDQIQEILENNIYPARGGAMGIVVIDSFADNTVSIDWCEFIGNYAGEFGGGLYVSLRGTNRNHSLSLYNTKFQQNRCKTSGAAIVMAFNIINRLDVPSVMQIIDCEFVENTANGSGAVLIVQLQNIGTGNYAVVKRTNFTKNRGGNGAAAINLGAVFNVQSRQLQQASLFEGCIFSNNNSTGGVMIASFNHINFTGNNIFIHNQGPGLTAAGSFLRVLSGNLSFLDNNAEAIGGGVALYISALSQLQIYKNSHIIFQNNFGSIGAAIRVDAPQLPLTFSEFISNPLCFLHYEDINIPPDKWQSGLLHFSGNHALLGSAIYASNVETCSYYTSDNQFNTTQLFDARKFPDWPVFDFGENTNTQHIENTTDQSFYIQTPAKRIISDPSLNGELTSYPGQTRQFDMVGLDEFNNPTYFVGRIIDEDESLSELLEKIFNLSSSFQPPDNYSIVYEKKDVPTAIFSPSLATFTPNKTFGIKYSIKLPPSEEISYYQSVEADKIINIQVEENNRIIFDLDFTLKILPCPPGFQLQRSTDDNSISCVCSGSQDNQFAVLDCADETNILILRDGYWASFEQESTNTQLLVVHTCPMTYCQCNSDQTHTQSCSPQYNVTNSNQQCHPPREGPLCGTCGNDTIVTILTLQCKENCEDSYTIYYATAILILGDILVIVFAILASMKFGLPFPHSLKGTVFYIQTAYFATEYFPITFWNLRKYMLFFSNILGLYFPIDFCFIKDAPTVLTFLPRFFPICLLIIISIIFTFFKRARIRMWYGVWALFQLLYVPLVHTCITLLHCPALPNTDGYDHINRWFLDASIKCFHNPSHVFLGIIAALFLIISIIVIPVIALLVILENESFIQEKHPGLINVIKTLKAGYLPKFKWWASVELLQRLLLVGIIAGLPGRTTAPIIVLFFIFVLYLYLKPHKYHVQNIMETVVLLNYMVLLVLRFTESILDSFNTGYTGTLIPSVYGRKLPSSSGMDVFFALIFYLPVAMGICVCGVWIIVRILKLINRTKKSKDSSNDDTKHDYHDHRDVMMEQKFTQSTTSVITTSTVIVD